MAFRANSDFILRPTRTTFRQADVEVRSDGVDADGSVFVEVFAHVGKLRGGQRHKVSTDALKLLAIRAVYSEARLILAFADGEAAASVSGVVRTRLRVPPDLDDQGAKERVINRLSQMRFTTEGRQPRGLYLLTCHEAKGREFDMVILPYVSDQIFPDDDDEEQRQLLYVALTRARQRILIRTAAGKLPKHCEAMGLAL